MDYPGGSRAVPATQEAINALEKTKLDNGSHKDGSAGELGTTCLEDMNLREAEVACMPCKHKFHHHCLARWLKTSNLCPLCHFTMPSSLSDVETLHQLASSFAYPKKQSCLSLSKSRFALRLGVPNIIICAHCPRDDADAGTGRLRQNKKTLFLLPVHKSPFLHARARQHAACCQQSRLDEAKVVRLGFLCTGIRDWQIHRDGGVRHRHRHRTPGSASRPSVEERQIFSPHENTNLYGFPNQHMVERAVGIWLRHFKKLF